MELRGDPENPNAVGPMKVLGGFWDWLLSPFAGQKEEEKKKIGAITKKEKKAEPADGNKKDPKGYIIAGSLFLVAVALLKVVSGDSDAEEELADATEGLAGAVEKTAEDVVEKVKDEAAKAVGGAVQAVEDNQPTVGASGSGK